MSEQAFNDAKSNLAFSQSLVDQMRLKKQADMQPMQPMAMEEQPSQEVQPSQPEAPVAEPAQETTQPSDAKGTNLSIQELANTVNTGMEALSKLAEAIKENTKEKKVSLTKLQDRLSKRKK